MKLDKLIDLIEGKKQAYLKRIDKLERMVEDLLRLDGAVDDRLAQIEEEFSRGAYLRDVKHFKQMMAERYSEQWAHLKETRGSINTVEMALEDDHGA